MANKVRRWPGSKMEENIPILLAELGYQTPRQTQVSGAVIYLSDDKQESFVPEEGRFISFCWLENCINAGMRTLEELLDDGPLFFGSAIWNDTDHVGLISFLQSAESVAVTLESKTYIFE